MMTMIFSLIGLVIFRGRWWFGLLDAVLRNQMVAASVLANAALGLVGAMLLRYSTSPTKAAMGFMRPLSLLVCAIFVGHSVTALTASGALISAVGVGIYVGQGPLKAPDQNNEDFFEGLRMKESSGTSVQLIIGTGVALVLAHLVVDTHVNLFQPHSA